MDALEWDREWLELERSALVGTGLDGVDIAQRVAERVRTVGTAAAGWVAESAVRVCGERVRARAESCATVASVVRMVAATVGGAMGEVVRMLGRVLGVTSPAESDDGATVGTVRGIRGVSATGALCDAGATSGTEPVDGAGAAGSAGTTDAARGC